MVNPKIEAKTINTASSGNTNNDINDSRRDCLTGIFIKTKLTLDFIRPYPEVGGVGGGLMR